MINKVKYCTTISKDLILALKELATNMYIESNYTVRYSIATLIESAIKDFLDKYKYKYSNEED